MSEVSDQPNPDEIKKKVRFVISFSIMLLLMYIGCFIIVILVKEVNDFSVGVNRDGLTTVIVYIITAIVSFVLMIRLFSLYRTRKKFINLLLAGFFLFSSLPAIIIGLQNIFVPNSEHIRYFLSLATFYLIPGSTVFFLSFLNETFYGGMDKTPDSSLFYVTNATSTIANLIALILSLAGHNFDFPFWALVLIMIFGGFFILLNVFLYFLFSYNSFKLYPRIDGKRQKTGLLLFGISGILLGLNFFGRFATFIFFEPTIITTTNLFLGLALDSVYLIGYVILYFGFTIPKQK